MREDRQATVYIACSDELLRLALARRIAAVPGLKVVADGAFEQWTPPGAVISAVADTSPEECRVLQLRGLVPLVLAALPNETQRSAFETSGAVYLAMDLEADNLITALGFAPIGHQADG